VSTVKPLYGTNNVTITCTLTSLANAAYRQSTAVDNTSNLYDEVKCQFIVKTGATVSGTPTISVYLYDSADGGTTYSDGASGTDGTMTPTATPNLKLLYVLSCPTASTVYKSDTFYVKSAAGLWVMPDHWGLVFLNNTGGALDATGATNKVVYEGLNPQIV
jgi:hypothetical protein